MIIDQLTQLTQKKHQGIFLYSTDSSQVLSEVNDQILSEFAKVSPIQIIENRQRIDLYDMANRFKAEFLDVDECLNNLLFTRPLSINQLHKTIIQLRIDFPVLITDLFGTFNLDELKEWEIGSKSKIIVSDIEKLSKSTPVLIGLNKKSVSKYETLYSSLQTHSITSIHVETLALPNNSKQLSLL